MDSSPNNLEPRLAAGIAIVVGFWLLVKVEFDAIMGLFEMACLAKPKNGIEPTTWTVPRYAKSAANSPIKRIASGIDR